MFCFFSDVCLLDNAPNGWWTEDGGLRYPHVFEPAALCGPMTDPWDERYIYLHEWLIFMGFRVRIYIYTSPIYTSPMDPMG